MAAKPFRAMVGENSRQTADCFNPKPYFQKY
jgi:hypothetical protein